MNFKNYEDEIFFIALGGTDQIGVNMYLYHYKGKWLIVDLGLGFADESYPGIDLIVPDITFLSQIRNDIVGIVITHAHEDHLGAIQYLWQEIKLPIYTTKFTSSVLKAKLSDAGILGDVEIHEVKENGKLKLDVFDIEFFGLTHSVPEMQALALRTDKGIIFHTGDWKFDKDPLIGKPTDFKRLKALGDEGVLAMVCDSTNIFSPGVSGSEGELHGSLKKLVGDYNKNLIIITTFASNIARVYSIAKAAQASGRRVAFAGKSLWRMYHAAKECGYLDDMDEPIQTRDIIKYKSSEVLVIATGCQGEYSAAMTRMSRNDHPDIKLGKNDVIIFASKIIPGNENSIFGVFNRLCKIGVEVLTEKDHFVHVSGHPNVDEVKYMYELIRPKIAIPVHGEPMHTHEHCHLARKQPGVKKAIQVENGAVVKIEKDSAEIIGKVYTGYLAIDGNFILPSDSDVLKMRRSMRDDGLVVVTIVLNKKGKLLKSPVILAPGVLDSKEDMEYFDKLTEDIRDFVQSFRSRYANEIESKIVNMTKKFFHNEIGKRPKIIVQVQKVAV